MTKIKLTIMPKPHAHLQTLTRKACEVLNWMTKWKKENNSARRTLTEKLTRVVRRQHSLPERADRIRKQSLNIKDYMQNLNIALNDRVWPDFDVWRMSNWGMRYMPLKYLPLGWCGQNMKTISYMLNPLVWCGQNTKAISYILQQSSTIFKTKTQL